MYIYMGRGGWLYDSEELVEYENKNYGPCDLLGEFAKDDHKAFWEYMEEHCGWYPKDNLNEYMEMTFDIPHPMYLCVVVQSKQSGRIMTKVRRFKIPGEKKRQVANELPNMFCYNIRAVNEVFKDMSYGLPRYYQCSELKLLREIDDVYQTYLVGKAEYEQEKDNEANTAWLLPEEIVPCPWQINVVDYIKQTFK